MTTSQHAAQKISLLTLIPQRNRGVAYERTADFDSPPFVQWASTEQEGRLDCLLALSGEQDEWIKQARDCRVMYREGNWWLLNQSTELSVSVNQKPLLIQQMCRLQPDDTLHCGLLAYRVALSAIEISEATLQDIITRRNRALAGQVYASEVPHLPARSTKFQSERIEPSAQFDLSTLLDESAENQLDDLLKVDKTEAFKALGQKSSSSLEPKSLEGASNIDSVTSFHERPNGTSKPFVNHKGERTPLMEAHIFDDLHEEYLKILKDPTLLTTDLPMQVEASTNQIDDDKNASHHQPDNGNSVSLYSMLGETDRIQSLFTELDDARSSALLQPERAENILYLFAPKDLIEPSHYPQTETQDILDILQAPPTTHANIPPQLTRYDHHLASIDSSLDATGHQTIAPKN